MPAVAEEKRRNVRHPATGTARRTSSAAARVTPPGLSVHPNLNSPPSALKQQQQQQQQQKQQRHNGVVASSSSSSIARLTPLALALQAQWTLLQRNIQLGAIPATAERDLLVVLESLPEHRNAILCDVEGVLPYILAFAVAPIPSERTQVIALGAMHATIGSLIAVWGKKAAAVLVHNFLTVEHNALHALVVTLSVALLEDDAIDGIESVKEGTQSHKKDINDRKKPRNDIGTMVTETRGAVIGGALELLLMMVSISPDTAAGALTYPKLIHAILRCLPVATAVQACDIASILHTLSVIDGAVEVLVGYKVYHAAVLFIRKSLRGGVGVVPNATVTAPCMFLRLVIQLTKSPASFTVLQDDPTTPHTMEKLLYSRWGEVMELGCQWITTVMEQHTARSAELVASILFKTQVGERLSSVVLWTSTTVSYAVAAALCWRWFALVNSTAASSFIISNPDVLFCLLQVLATTPPSPSLSSSSSGMMIPLQLANVVDLQDASHKNVAIHRLLTEVVCTLGLCYALSPRETRAAMRHLVLHRLSNVTKAEIQRRVTFMFANLDKAYFTQYPAMTWTYKRESVGGNSILERNRANAAISIKDDDDENEEEIVLVNMRKKGNDVYNDFIVTETEKQLGDKSEGVHSLQTSKEWHSFLLHSLTRLFRGNARGVATVALNPQQQQQQQQQQKQLGTIAGGPSALLRMPSPPLSNGVDQRYHHHHHHSCHTNPPFATATCNAAQSPSTQWGVVRRAEHMGGSFYLDSIRVILRLAHHYKHGLKKNEDRVSTRSHVGSAPPCTTRVSGRQGKAPNPWALPEKVDSSRRWSIEDVQRSDVLLFYVSYETIVAELEEATEAVEEHTKYLGRCLRLCPTKAVLRRCLLNDLYMHVYPKIHMFLRFIQHHMGRSAPVLQIIAEKERAIHSGNILEIHEAVGHCVGDVGEGGMGWEQHR